MLVLHFGVVHDEDCPELSTTRDWVPIDDLPGDSLSELDLTYCPGCLDGPVDELIEAAESTVRASAE